MQSYNAKQAWRRAAVFFAVCFVLAAFSGALAEIATTAIATHEQRHAGYWWPSVFVVSGYTLFAYGFFWPRGTVTYGRRRYPGYALLFGFFWGTSQGLLAFSAYRIVANLELAPIWTVAIVFVLYSGYSAVWQSRYWDIYVAPPHNDEAWNLRKVLVCHIPFLLLVLTHLALFDNALLFVMWQAVAMMLSAFHMHFPPPFANGDAPQQTENMS